MNCTQCSHWNRPNTDIHIGLLSGRQISTVLQLLQNWLSISGIQTSISSTVLHDRACVQCIHTHAQLHQLTENIFVLPHLNKIKTGIRHVHQPLSTHFTALDNRGQPLWICLLLWLECWRARTGGMRVGWWGHVYVWELRSLYVCVG